MSENAARRGPLWDGVNGYAPMPAVRSGRLRGHGRVTHRDHDTAFPEACLVDADGTLLATTAGAQLIPRDRAPTAP